MKTRIALFLLLLSSAAFPALLRSQSTETSIAFWALINIESGEVTGECHTVMQGDTDAYYPSVGVSSCVVQLTTNPNESQSCTDLEEETSASCTTPALATLENSSYWTKGLHTLGFYDGDSVTCTNQYEDPLGYAEAISAACGSETCGYPTLDGSEEDPPCVSGSPLLFAYSTSNVFTPITISPQGAQVYGGKTLQYSSNDCPNVTWNAVLGKITPSSGGACGGLYTAPSVSGSNDGEIDTITATSTANTNNRTSTTVQILSGAVIIGNYTPTMNQGQTQTFTATENGCDTGNCVTWKALLGKIDANTGVYTAPSSVTTQQADMITATSTSDSTLTDAVSVILYPITVSFIPVPPILDIPGSQTTLSVIVNTLAGNPLPTCVWSVVSPAGAGSFTNTSCSSATYIPPAITAPEIVTINVCVITNAQAPNNPQICATTPLTVTLVPPVLVTSLGGSWNAGQPNPITINGTGFGTNPNVTFTLNGVAGGGVSITFGSVSNTQIIATVTLPVEASAVTLIVCVADTTAGIGPPIGCGSVNVVPDTFTVNPVTPGSISLDETQTVQFTGGTASCRTPGGFTCTAPNPVWSISSSLSNPGSISQSGFYQAPSSGVMISTPVTGKACIGTNCSNFTITLLAILISVNPSGTSLNGGGAETFTATVMNSPVSSVTWTPVTAGSIASTGATTALYTAPNPITTTVPALVIQACSTLDSSRCGSTTVKLQAADFTISVTPSSQVVLAGGSAAYTVSISPTAGFTGNVTLSLSGLPSGATDNFSPLTISGGSGASTLTVFSNTAHAGASQLTVTGTSGSLVHSATPITFSITDFGFTIGPASGTAFVGGSTPFTVTVSPLNGFTGNVALSASSSPKGPTVGFSLNTIASGSGSSTMTVSVPAGTAPGTYTLTVTGTSGNIIHTATATLNVPVPDFTLSTTNYNWAMGQGGTMTNGTITVAPLNGFTGTVSLTLTWNYNQIPAGLTSTFSPPTIPNSSGSSVLTYTSSPSTPPAIYYPIITATSGSLTHLLYGTLQVYPASNSINWLAPWNAGGGSPSPPNTMDVHGIVLGGTGTVQLLWNDTTLATGWQTISPPLVPDAYGNYWGTIPSAHYCHSFSAESIYVGMTSAVYNYTGQGSSYCTLKTIWIQPEALAGYGPPGSLVVAGSAIGAPSGTVVTMFWRDATANGAWTNGGSALPDPTSNIWINAIPSVNYAHQYSVYLTYDGINNSSTPCTYTGNNQIKWCP